MPSNLQGSTGSPGGSHTFTVNIRIDGSTSALSSTTNNTTTTCSDTDEVTVTAGQLISIQIPNDGIGGSRTTAAVRWSLTLK